MSEPRKRVTLIAAAAAGVVGLVAVAVIVTLAVTNGGQPAKPATPAVPVIANIPQPNAKCTPAADRKIGLGEDLTQIQWFGWMDGKQADMPLNQAMVQRIAGHKVEDAWYCPPRAAW